MKQLRFTPAFGDGAGLPLPLHCSYSCIELISYQSYHIIAYRRGDVPGREKRRPDPCRPCSRRHTGTVPCCWSNSRHASPNHRYRAPAINQHRVQCCFLTLLVVVLVARWTRDRKVAGSTPGRGAIKSSRSTQPSIPPG